jgi:hypothetical protein
MTAYIEAQITALDGLSRKQLLERWRALYKNNAPSGIRRELMIPFLAYRTQEIAYGGLSAATRAQIKAANRSIESARKPSGRPPKQPVKVGTQFLRRWGSVMHVVSATEAGFDYQGKSYRSLSEIARLITGTRWSGPAFFGLKKP